MLLLGLITSILLSASIVRSAVIPPDTPVLKLKRSIDPAMRSVIKTSNKGLTFQTSVEIAGSLFLLDVNTATPDLWVHGPQVANAKQSMSLTQQGVTDLNMPFSGMYGSGVVFGNVGSATISVSSLTVEKQLFGVTQSESGMDGLGAGMLGLGLPLRSRIAESDPNAKSFLESAKVNLFAIHLPLTDAEDGELLFGTINSDKFKGEVMYEDVESNSYWRMTVNSATVNGQQMPFTVEDTVTDTASSFITLDDSVVEGINAAIGASQLTDNAFSIPCSSRSTAPPVSFTSSTGHVYTIPASIYIMDDASLSDSLCLSAFARGASHSNVAIFGVPFLRTYYSIYDIENRRIGFAPATH